METVSQKTGKFKMLSGVNKILKYSINRFTYYSDKIEKIITKTKEKVPPYHSLSPISDADDRKGYMEALTWALNNREKKNIKNIALTGDYGSGKTTILSTFQKNNKNKDFHFLNISLATFKEEEKEKEKNKTSGENLLRLIELSILQQLFYTEEDRMLPDSRLRKIRSFSKRNLFTIALSVLIFLVVSISLFFPQEVYDFLKISPPKGTWELNFHYGLLTLFIAGSLWLFYRSARVMFNIRLSKLSFQNAEIEIDDKINKSILNHHIDEILYFFQATPYNIVMIEDLDRFQETEIFTKLREINSLINNSKKIIKKKRNVVFIYAVRDEMFKDKDRTKFFDFIIPVIPTINSSNSDQKFLDKIEVNKYEISEDLVDDISLFIDDMRLVHNIFNEFYMYKSQLSEQLIQDKLLAIITYKNIFPTDFVDLGRNKGNLYDTIHIKKQEYINQITKSISDRIDVFKDKIKVLEELNIKDAEELRKLYLYHYIVQILSGDKVLSFQINNDNKSFEQIIQNEELFDYFVENKVSKFYYDDYYTTSFNINFQSIEQKVNPNHTYKERLEYIKDLHSGKINLLKKEIQEFENEKANMKKEKLSTIIKDGNIVISLQSEGQDKSSNVNNKLVEKQNQLLNILLRNGYIDENYIDYITIFHEGSTSKNDDEFRLRVKQQKETDFSHQLDKIDGLIKKISISDFDKEYILNYNLMDYVLVKDIIIYKTKFFSLLRNESDISIQFIKGYILRGINIGLFTKELCSKWENILNFIFTQSVFPDEEKDTYLKLIIEYANISDIEKFNQLESFKTTIANVVDFDKMSENKSKLKAIIRIFNLKFNDIDFTETSDDMLNFIYEGFYYKLNPVMLKKFIRAKGEFNQPKFDTENYSSIKNSNAYKLIDYVDSNINFYIENTYLSIENNINEREEYLVTLLNNDQIDIKNKALLMLQVETKLRGLSQIIDKEVKKLILQSSKVHPSWLMLINYYKQEGILIENDEKVIFSNFPKEMVTFINVADNFTLLSKNKIDKENPDNEVVKKFLVHLILCNDISDNAYSQLIKSVPYSYSKLDFLSLSENKIYALVTNKKLKLNPENYTTLKENFLDFHINLIENWGNEYIENITDFELNGKDIILLLESKIISLEEKNQITNHVSDSVLISQIEILSLLGNLIIQKSSYEISNDVLKAILIKSRLNISVKIEVFNCKYTQLNQIDITNFLISLGEPYSEIVENGKRPVMPDNKTNKLFVHILKDINYISKYDFDKKGIRISTFRNKQEG